MPGIDKPLPIVVGIDVEPDPRLTDPQRPQPWRGFEELLPLFTEMRSQLSARRRAPVQFSWFFRLDPQIAGTYGDPAWPLHHYAHEVAALLAAGDEIGVHTHAYRWQAAQHTWIADDGDQAWVDHCITSSLAAFESYFHRPCLAHKFGDRWMNDATLATLEGTGVRADLTLEPGVVSARALQGEVYTGTPPECSAVARRVYRPAPDDFRQPDPNGRRRICLLPLSTWRVPWYIQMPRRIYHRLRPAGTPTPGDESSRATVTIRPGFRPYLFRSLVARLLASREAEHLALVFRSSEGTLAAQRQRIATNVLGLLSGPCADRLRFVGPQAALQILEHASPDP